MELFLAITAVCSFWHRIGDPLQLLLNALGVN